ncbi:outer membrane beta-barrel protein [Aliivibrio fischeri]|uniref:outer membrane beta-barrel protein n=1 Tax=Aliivibrio fischeri TaxID=668 RepID=UPI00373697F9
MKKILVVSLMAASLNVAHAAGSDYSGLYVGADYVQSDMLDILAATRFLGPQTSNSESTGYSVQVGYTSRLTENLYLSSEFSYADLGSAKVSGQGLLGPYTGEVSATSYGVNLMPKYHFGGFYVGVIGGLNNLSADVAISSTKSSVDEWKLLTGAEIGYSFQQVGINLGYKSIDDISAVYLGMDYTF